MTIELEAQAEPAASGAEAKPPSETIHTTGEYRIYIAPVEVRNGFVEVRGTVTNRTDQEWGPLYRLGIRNFRRGDGSPCDHAEFRALTPKLTGGLRKEVPFMFRIPQAAIPAGAETCDMDMVHEGVAWFATRGAQPATLDLSHARPSDTRAAWILELYRVLNKTSGQERSRMELLIEMLERMDFASLAAVDQIRNLTTRAIAGEPHYIPAPSSVTIEACCTRDGNRDLVAAIFERYALSQGIREADVGSPLALVGAFAGVAKGDRSFFRGGTIPIPLTFAEWLNKRALPKALAENPITRSMVAALPKEGAIDVAPLDGGNEILSWFAQAVLVGCHLSVNAVPPIITQRLGSPERAQDPWQKFPVLTGFMRLTYEADPMFRVLYDVDTDYGRLGLAFHLLILFGESEAGRALLGKDIMSTLTRPLPHQIGSMAEILLLASIGAPPPAEAGEKTPSTKQEPLQILQRYYDWLPAGSVAKEDRQFRVIGEHRTSTGLGVNMAMSLEALASLGLAPDVVDVARNMLFPADNPRSARRKLSRPVDLFHLNLETVPSLVSRYSSAQRSNVYRIAFALWETSVMPPEHKAGMLLADEIWAPTEYVATIYRQAGHPNVHIVGKGISLPEPNDFPLSQLNIPRDAFTLMASFDVGSWLERKNPAAVIRAFELAFPDDPSARLIIKSTGLSDHPGDRSGQVEFLTDAAARDRRIVLLSQFLDFEDYLGLIRNMNVTVSAHRSEGFGYLPAYSMLMGTPTIVTDHSGTTDFCNEKTAFPVACKTVPIAAGDFVFNAPGAQWADIDIGDLAAKMREVRANPAGARQRTFHGKEFIERNYSMPQLAKNYEKRLRSFFTDN